MSDTKPSIASLRIDRSESARPNSGGTGRWLLVFLAALGLAVAVWFALRPRELAVRVGTAQATGGGTASSAGISANGYVVARTKASVAAKIPGRLEFLGVSEGTRVRKGDVIARLESGDYAAQLASARATVAQFEAQLAQAQRDLQRAEALRKDRLNSDFDLESATTQVRVLQSQRDAARALAELAAVNLENTRVRAPFNGTVLRKDAEVGEIVVPSSAGGGLTRTAICTMADLGTLEVEVDVNEAYIAQIENGQRAAITLDAYPDTSFAGRVRQVVPTADRQKATVLVKVSILDHDPRLLPEMGARVVFVRDASAPQVAAAPRRVTIPRAALVQGADGACVWVVQDGTVRSLAVEPGPERGESVEIRSGLEGGESVVLDPPAELANGRKVRPLPS